MTNPWAQPTTPEGVVTAIGGDPKSLHGLTPVERMELLTALVSKYCRQMADARNLFSPLPGEGERFMKSRARVQLATRSNRGGKTLHVAAKIANIISGRGESLGFPQRDGRLMAVGRDWDHVGDVMWRKLAWPGAFQIIRDADTGLWRAIRLNAANPLELDPADVARRAEWKPAPPFIPPDEIDVSYENRGREQPSRVVHKATGWETWFFSSRGEPRNGIDANAAWFDEEIEREQWVPETLFRLVDRDGILLWSFTPQASTPQAYEFHKRAEAGDPAFEEFNFYIYNNPYLPQQAKDEIRRALSPSEVAVRWYGQYAITGRRVYPNFNIHDLHGVEALPDGGDHPRPDWMKVFFVDPGFQTCGVLFGAIPPKTSILYPSLYIYDELYLHGSNCAKYGEEVAAKTRDTLWEVAGIDYRFGRQSQATSGRPLADHYSDEHRARNIRTRKSGNGFVWGSDNVEGRTDAVHALLDKSRIRVVRKKCPNLIREMEGEYFKKDSPDQRDTRKYGHLVACLEMMAAYFDAMGGLYWDSPLPLPKDAGNSPAFAAYKKKQRTHARLAS